MSNRATGVAVAMLLTMSAQAATSDLLPLAHGTYVREGYEAADAPLAAVLEYDGSTIAGAHSSACVSEVLEHDGAAYRIETTCRSAGDGTPATPYKEEERIVVLSPTRMRFAHRDDQAVYRLVRSASPTTRK